MLAAFPNSFKNNLCRKTFTNVSLPSIKNTLNPLRDYFHPGFYGTTTNHFTDPFSSVLKSDKLFGIHRVGATIFVFLFFDHMRCDIIIAATDFRVPRMQRFLMDTFLQFLQMRVCLTQMFWCYFVNVQFLCVQILRYSFFPLFPRFFDNLLCGPANKSEYPSLQWLCRERGSSPVSVFRL